MRAAAFHFAPSWPGSSGPPVAARCQADELLPHALRIQSFEQVQPVRVLIDNQVQFPLSRPVFEPLLPLDRCFDPLVPFHVHKAGEPISGGERRCHALAVFPGSAGDVVRDSNVECAECFVGHDVNPAAHHSATMGVAALRKCEQCRNRAQNFRGRMASIRRRHGPARPGYLSRHVPVQVARTSRAMTVETSWAMTAKTSWSVTAKTSLAMTVKSGRAMTVKASLTAMVRASRLSAS